MPGVIHTPRAHNVERPTYQTARGVNIVLGAWLFLSAFCWHHSQAQMMNTWLVGAVSVGIALLALGFPALRYLNSLLAVWLFISVFVLPSVNAGTRWNNAVVAVGIFFASLYPPAPLPRLALHRRAPA